MIITPAVKKTPHRIESSGMKKYSSVMRIKNSDKSRVFIIPYPIILFI
jgi:hypothetical protein